VDRIEIFIDEESPHLRVTHLSDHDYYDDDDADDVSINMVNNNLKKIIRMFYLKISIESP
jgi:hypothetical protein